MKGGGDATSAARAVLQTGEFDFAWNLQVEDDILKRLEAGGKGRVVASPGGAPEFVELNSTDPWTEVEGERAHASTRHPIWRHAEVRKAFGLLVDRASIQQFVYERLGVATATIAPMATCTRCCSARRWRAWATGCRRCCRGGATT